jgi:hypothetical protein
MKPANSRFVVCLVNRGYAASLVVRRLCPVLPDSIGESHDMIRIIDESGDDYLYPRKMFAAVALTRTVEKRLTTAR